MIYEMHNYRGHLSDSQQLQVREAIHRGLSVRAAAKELDLPYGQVRGYAEYLQTTDKLLVPPHSPAMLVMDIETAPNLIWSWGLWKQNAIDVEQYGYMLSFAYGWYNLETDSVEEIDFVSIFQNPDFEPNKPDDKYVVERLWRLLDRADIVIGQNSKAFDVKTTNARAIVNGFLPPSSFTQIDTKNAAKEVGRFPSNSLKHLARQLGVSLKAENRGFDLWRGCMEGNPLFWYEMEEYNKQDVKATAEIYTVLRPWMTGRNHPNLGLYIASEGMVCTKCGNKETTYGGKGFQFRGNRMTTSSAYRQVRCNKCGGYSREWQRKPQREPLQRVDLRP